MSASPFELFRKRPPPKRSAAELYQEALVGRRAAYEALREATLSLVYLRQRLEAEAFERRTEIARLHDEARRLAKRGADQAALEKLLAKQAHRAALAAQEDRAQQIKREAELAKAKLSALGLELRTLEAEGCEARAMAQVAARWQQIEALELETSALKKAAQAAAGELPHFDPTRDLEDDLTSARLDLAVLKKA
jgi:hypothetical protein